MRNFGLDVHRTFAEVALLDERGVRSAGRIDLTAEALHAFGRQLAQDDDVVLEATCNTHAIARLLRAYVRRVVVSNPLQTRAIAEAKVKTDKIGGRLGPLARLRLFAGGLEPGRADGADAPLGRPARDHRAAPDAFEEPHPRDPAPQSASALPGGRLVRSYGSELAGGAGAARR